MAPRPGKRDDVAVEETYTPDQNRSLSDAIVAAIAAYKGIDPLDSEFILYESVDTDALCELFEHVATPTMIEFTVDDAVVRCWSDGVKIRVTNRDGAVTDPSDEADR